MKVVYKGEVENLTSHYQGFHIGVLSEHLTPGEIYDTLYNGSSIRDGDIVYHYRIMNDRGIICDYPSNLFKPLRENNLNTLLE